MMHNTRLVLGLGAIIIAMLLVVFVTFARQPTAVKPETKAEVKAEPFFKVAVENDIKGLYNEGLKFSIMDYVQWDPMENGLWHCKNTFKGKQTKKDYNYIARLSYEEETKVATLYYLKINDKVVIWDEKLEDLYLENN